MSTNADNATASLSCMTGSFESEKSAVVMEIEVMPEADDLHARDVATLPAKAKARTSSSAFWGDMSLSQRFDNMSLFKTHQISVKDDMVYEHKREHDHQDHQRKHQQNANDSIMPTIQEQPRIHDHHDCEVGGIGTTTNGSVPSPLPLLSSTTSQAPFLHDVTLILPTPSGSSSAYSATPCMADAVLADSTTMNVNEKKHGLAFFLRRTLFSRQRCMIMILGTLVVVGAAVGAIIVVRPTLAPHSKGNVKQIKTTSQMDAYYATITNILLPPGSIVSLAPDAPQFQALKWLAYQDTIYWDPYTHFQQLQQRYVLAVLYFANSGPLWTAVANSWIVGGMGIDQCSWVLVDCTTNNTNSIPVTNATNTSTTSSSSSAAASSTSFATATSSSSSSSSNGVVTGLRLIGGDNGVKMTGTLPSELGLLTSLTALMLSQNQLQGSIPDTLYDLTDLGNVHDDFSFSVIYPPCVYSDSFPLVPVCTSP